MRFSTLVSVLVCCIALLLCNKASAQKVQKAKANINGLPFNYCYLQPEGNITGIVILLPGAGEPIKNVFSKTQLPSLLADRGYVTIVPEVHSLLFADEYTINVLNSVIKLQEEKYGVHPYLIGGFSSGGAIAVRYAELVLAKDTVNNLKGLIAIDPPLDLQRIYASSERKIISCDGIIKKEGYLGRAQLLQAMGGTPELQFKNYVEHSGFTASAADGGNARYLKNLPLRLYSEPDLSFVQKTYCPALQYEDINSCDLERLSKFLNKTGNTKAEYITTKGKGFHSWNVLDAAGCAEWVASVCH